jgi:hypothetical protein
MSSSAELNGLGAENFLLLQNSDSETQFTTKFNNPSKSDQHQNPPPYVATMPESTDNVVAGTAAQNSGEQALLVPTLTMATVGLQGILRDYERLQGEIVRLQGEIVRLQGENARLQGENARLQGRLDGDGEGGQKRLLILFVVLLVFLLFGRTFASPIINGWFKSNGNAKTTN